MAVLYKPTPYDTKLTHEGGAEQEHKDSCDINKMILAAHRGQQIRQARPGLWVDGGVDDMNQTLTSLKLQKEYVEQELADYAQKNELSEEEWKAFPKEVKEKFKLRKKALQKQNDQTKQNQEQQNEAKNSSPSKNASPSESASAGASKSS